MQCSSYKAIKCEFKRYNKFKLNLKELKLSDSNPYSIRNGTIEMAHRALKLSLKKLWNRQIK